MNASKPKAFQCKVTSFEMMTPTVFELKFELDGEMTFVPGQFASILIPGAGPSGRDIRRAYSIASEPERKEIELCIKKVEGGPGTTYLHGLKVGDEIKVFAPYGKFVYEPKPGRDVCFISTGTGIAPFRSMMLSELWNTNTPPKTTCIFGVRTKDEILYKDEISKLPNVTWSTSLSREEGTWDGHKGRVTDYVRSLDDKFNWLGTDYYLCGNGDMITEIKQILTDRGVDKNSILQEKYY